MIQKVIFLLFIPLFGIQAAKWPKFKWEQIDPVKANINYVELYDIQKYVFDKNSGYQTNSLLIVKDGKLVFDRYEEGFDFMKPQKLWSISKSVVNAVIGVAIQNEKINLNDKISSLYPELSKTPSLKNLAVKDLLHMSSGIAWNEGYENDILKSNVLAQLYGAGKKDMATYVASLSSACNAGSCFNYSSGDTNLLLGYLKKSLGEDVYADYPWKYLFRKIGARSAVWERDKSGTFVGSSYVYMTLRDLAKLGQLYLEGGRVNAEQLIHRDYIKWSLTTAPSLSKASADQKTYGASWWLNMPVNDKAPRPYPDLPEDAFFALGHWGQVMAIIPSEKLIVIRTGVDKKEKIDLNKMVSMILNATRSEGDLQ